MNTSDIRGLRFVDRTQVAFRNLTIVLFGYEVSLRIQKVTTLQAPVQQELVIIIDEEKRAAAVAAIDLTSIKAQAAAIRAVNASDEAIAAARKARVAQRQATAQQRLEEIEEKEEVA